MKCEQLPPNKKPLRGSRTSRQKRSPLVLVDRVVAVHMFGFECVRERDGGLVLEGLLLGADLRECAVGVAGFR